MTCTYSEETRLLTVTVSDKITTHMAADIRAQLGRLNVALIHIDVSSVTRISVVGLRLLSNIKEFSDLSGADFKIIGRKRNAVRSAFEFALALTSVYTCNPTPNAYLDRIPPIEGLSHDVA